MRTLPLPKNFGDQNGCLSIDEISALLLWKEVWSFTPPQGKSLAAFIYESDRRRPEDLVSSSGFYLDKNWRKNKEITKDQNLLSQITPNTYELPCGTQVKFKQSKSNVDLPDYQSFYVFNQKTSRKSRLLKCTEEGCGKLFNKMWNLADHIWAHKKEKPFACRTCNKTFSVKGNLSKHERRHDQSEDPRERKNHFCPFCSKSYTEKYNLTVHVKKAHPSDFSGYKSDNIRPRSVF